VAEELIVTVKVEDVHASDFLRSILEFHNFNMIVTNNTVIISKQRHSAPEADEEAVQPH